MKKIFGVLGAVLLIIGLFIFIFSVTSSLGIIGGADGPTVFFTAGNISGIAWVFPLIAGILLIIVSCVFPLKKKK